MTRWRWLFADLRKRIWFRAAAISFLAVLLALAGAWLAPLIPYEWSINIGGEAVDAVLSILATSLLAVTTFSLTAMVTAFSGASQQISPRAVHLLIEDRTAQNALSTFLGGFVFALVSIVALSTGFYGQEGRVVLFAGTIAMAAAIVITLLRWIARLVHFGRVEDSIKRIEKQTVTALCQMPAPLVLAGHPQIESSGRATLRGSRFGFVAHIDRDAISELAVKRAVLIELAVRPGELVDPSTVLMHASEELSDEDCENCVDSISISRRRDLSQDPRFGFQLLAEIAVRALSPAVNDPETAIAALHSALRILFQYVDGAPPEPRPLAGLVDRPLELQELLELLLLPVSRDAAGMLEAAAAIQYLLGSLAKRMPVAQPFLLAAAREALDRSRKGAMSALDFDRLQQVHQRELGPGIQQEEISPRST